MKNLKIFAAIATFVLMMGIFAVIPVFSAQPPVDKSTYYVGTIGQPVRVDPARAYDTASGALLQNIYQTLMWWNDTRPVTYNVDHAHQLVPADFADLKMYEPVVCTEVPTVANGRLIINATGSYWRFTINPSVMYSNWTSAYNGAFHAARQMTANDVVYSFRRQMIYDSPYSPVWMYLSPAFGIPSWRDVYGGLYPTYSNGTFVNTDDEIAAGNMIANWCYAVGNDVYFHFQLPWATDVLNQIFGQTWGGIINPDWAKEYGAWDGVSLGAGWTNNWHFKPTSTRSELDTWKDPALYPAGVGAKYSQANWTRGAAGSGPYKFTSWDLTNKIVRIDWDANYWRGWANAGDKLGNHLTTVIWKGIDAWPTRKMLFLEGEFDVCVVPTANMYDLLVSTYVPIAGINLVYNVGGLQNDVLLFGFNVAETSAYQSYVGYPTHKTGAQPLFFANEHMRRAFAWAFNYTSYLADAWFGEGILQRTWWVDGLSPESYKNTNASMPMRNIDLTEVQNELNLAVFDGFNVGTEGFDMKLVYNIGNDQRLIACNLFASAFASLGSKYHIEIVGVDWPVFLDAQNAGELPMYDVGWLADFADPDNFCEPYQKSSGAFMVSQGPPFPADQAFVDAEIDAAMIEQDFDTRGDMYMDLQYRYWLDVPSFPLVQPTGRRFARDWVQGWYFNSLLPGLYAYNQLWKTTTTLQNVDVDMTGTVTPATPTYNPVYIFHSQMRKGNGDPSPATMTYTLHITRNDANAEIVTLYAAVGLRRVSAGDNQFANGTYVSVLAGDEASATVIWWEDGVNQFMAGSTTGISYAVNGEAAVMNQEAQDSVPANNVQPAGTLVAKTLTGDITGDGFVDIFDAIQLANAFGTHGPPGASLRWNADADLNVDNIIDIFDAILLANNFNKHVP